MDTLIGVLATVFSISCLYIAYTVGLRHAKQSILDKRTEQEEMQLELQRVGMENVMNYDMDVALGRRGNK